MRWKKVKKKKIRPLENFYHHQSRALWGWIVAASAVNFCVLADKYRASPEAWLQTRKMDKDKTNSESKPHYFVELLWTRHQRQLKCFPPAVHQKAISFQQTNILKFNISPQTSKDLTPLTSENYTIWLMMNICRWCWPSPCCPLQPSLASFPWWLWRRLGPMLSSGW